MSEVRPVEQSMTIRAKMRLEEAAIGYRCHGVAQRRSKADATGAVEKRTCSREVTCGERASSPTADAKAAMEEKLAKRLGRCSFVDLNLDRKISI